MPDNQPNEPQRLGEWSPGLAPPVHVPFLSFLKIRPVTFGGGAGTFELVVEERHLRTNGIAHGGVVASLLDTCMGWAAASKAPAGQNLVTVQLNVNYIRPAWDSETLRARGEVMHAGKQTAVTRGEVRTAADVLVASGTATFMYINSMPPRGDNSPLPKHAD